MSVAVQNNAEAEARVEEGPRLSALVVARDEEARLPACLERLGFCDEIVVVIDRATDRSRQIAESFGARVVEGAWGREGERRNAGLEACRGEWVLEIDADEHVPEALACEIRATIGSSEFDWHSIPFHNHVGERLVRHGWGASFGVRSSARLSRQGRKRWQNERVHPGVRLEGRKGPMLRTPIEHHVDRNISDMLRRLDRYTSARAKDLRERGLEGESLRRNVRRIFSRCFKCYVTRKGYREGGYGLLIAVLAGLFPLISYLKATLEDEHERPRLRH